MQPTAQPWEKQKPISPGGAKEHLSRRQATENHFH